MPAAVFGGTGTFWRDWGKGRRRAVMVHCSLAHSGAWGGVAERLADAMQLQAFDLPGHGRSGPWDPARDYQDQACEMALGLIGAGPVDLVGHSFGAVTCLRIALEHPGLVRSLALYEPVLFAAAAAGGFDTRTMFAAFDKAMRAGDDEASARIFAAIWGAGEPWDEIPAPQHAMITDRIGLIAAGAPSIHDDRAGLLRPGRLESLDRPVLLMEGDASPPVIPAINASLVARLPDTARAVIAGARHTGPISHPGEVAAAIGRHFGL